MAAYAWASKHGGDAAAVEDLCKLFANVPVLDTGARGSTITFAKRGLYSRCGQEIIAASFYRPRDPAVLAKAPTHFPNVPMVNIADFGGWPKVEAAQFAGGVFDRIYKPH